MSKRKCGNCRWCVRKDGWRFCNYFRRQIFDNEEAQGCLHFEGW